ncbi:MAG: HAD family hydrolase, partial [Pseudonocardiaceae bacterium]
TAERYRATFTRPLQNFYAAVFNRRIADEDFVRLETLFHAAYRRRMIQAALDDGALAALTAWRDAGRSQSLLSLWSHDELVVRVRGLGVTSYFSRIDGRRGLGAAGIDSKAEPLRLHLVELMRLGDDDISAAVAARDVVMIGDTLDDAAAAAASDIGCVLFAGGAHDIAELAATGFPVTATLAEAVGLVAEVAAGSRRK